MCVSADVPSGLELGLALGIGIGLGLVIMLREGLSKLLTCFVLRSTQPLAFSGTGNER